MLSGWYARSFGSIVLSAIVTLVWGGLVLGMMPGAAGISWQAHTGGFIGGVLAARAYRIRGRRNVIETAAGSARLTK
jgi:membrane associated rhomboid family serine protease